LRGLQFFSADISALYTNLSATGCIESLMEMAEEFWESLNQLDQICFTLTDIRNILTLVFKESYFTFNSRLYYQTLGLFMGCCPSPLGAIIRVWKFEKSSLYIDVNYISSFYGRYVDDCGSFAKSKELAVQITTRIEEQDPSGRLKFEVDFPETPNTYTPFLDTEIMVDSTGNVNTRLYRKPQKKNITLHWRSHHTTQTKREVAKNFYRTARKVSSGPEQIDHSIGKIDDLLRRNGFTNPRQWDINYGNRSGRSRHNNTNNSTVCVLPYISESLNNTIRNYTRNRKIPIKLVFKPGTKLRNMFTSSRPFDTLRCMVGNSCKICPNIEGKFGCAQKNCVYSVICLLCHEEYHGETSRPLHDRLLEHQRAAFNPPSYPNNSVGEHYLTKHLGVEPKLKYKVLNVQNSTIRRKVSEAASILQHKPAINDKNELQYLRQFLV